MRNPWSARLTFAATILSLSLAACTTSGNADCDPPTPHQDWFAGDGPDSGLVEIRATPADPVEVWGLIWTTPPIPVGVETKMVWKVIGDGEDFAITAFRGSEQTNITWGVNEHDQSNWDREGDEYGVAFTFPTEGCWDIQVTRGNETVHTYVQVEDRT